MVFTWSKSWITTKKVNAKLMDICGSVRKHFDGSWGDSVTLWHSQHHCSSLLGLFFLFFLFVSAPFFVSNFVQKQTRATEERLSPVLSVWDSIHPWWLERSLHYLKSNLSEMIYFTDNDNSILNDLTKAGARSHRDIQRDDLPLIKSLHRHIHADLPLQQKDARTVIKDKQHNKTNRNLKKALQIIAQSSLFCFCFFFFRVF